MILMHDPTGLDPIRDPTFIEHQNLLDGNFFLGPFSADLAILAGGLPVSGLSFPVGSLAVRVLVTARTKEIPHWIL